MKKIFVIILFLFFCAILPADDFLTIIAVGDNLYNDAMVSQGEEGDYETAYREIKSLVKEADISFINQETMLGGKDFGFSGFPQFNSPQALGKAIAAAGFNVVNHTSNHVLDKGEEALFATLDFWETFPDVTVLGVHRTERQRSIHKILEKNNIKVGFLSYSYGTNAIDLPEDKPWLVSLIDTEIMEKEIKSLRPLCDVLVVSMHWGEEYKFTYSKNQENLAAFLAEHQVDIVLGHHSHVLQPAEYILRPDGRFMLCFYSLGNFLSGQSRIATMLGAMACIKIKKTKDSFIFVYAGVIPLVTHYERSFTNLRVYPLYSYNNELADKHWLNRDKKELTIKYLSDLSSVMLGEKMIHKNPFP